MNCLFVGPCPSVILDRKLSLYSEIESYKGKKTNIFHIFFNYNSVELKELKVSWHYSVSFMPTCYERRNKLILLQDTIKLRTKWLLASDIKQYAFEVDILSIINIKRDLTLQ